MRIRTATLIVLAGLAVLGFSNVERPILRLATGKELVRVVVVVPQHADHRWLAVDGAVFDAQGDATWERTTWEQLEGADAPRSRTLEWHLPRANPYETGSRTLRVRASVVCETAEGQAYIP